MFFANCSLSVLSETTLVFFFIIPNSAWSPNKFKIITVFAWNHWLMCLKLQSFKWLLSSWQGTIITCEALAFYAINMVRGKCVWKLSLRPFFVFYSFTFRFVYNILLYYLTRAACFESTAAVRENDITFSFALIRNLHVAQHHIPYTHSSLLPCDIYIYNTRIIYPLIGLFRLDYSAAAAQMYNRLVLPTV